MEDNYLWDRSGEPDPEVQELEEILGPLRYQPRPLQIPHDIRLHRRRTPVPAMAIAAAIALFAILLGLWFSFNRRRTAPAVEVRHDSQTGQNRPLEVARNNPAPPRPVAVDSPRPTRFQKRESPRNLSARNAGRSTRTQVREPGLTEQELAEKEQVLTALRLVSVKLNLAQRKTQGPPQLNMIRNQHKIG